MGKQIFKIRNRNTGEFATASGWSKNGKHWNHLGHVKSHLNGWDCDKKYKDADLVTYELVEASREPMGQMIINTLEEKKKKEADRHVAIKRWTLEEAKRKYEEAKRNLEELGD